MELLPRTAPSSATVMSEIVLPQHANALGTAFGGTIMSWIDVCGAICAQRHCGRVAVTAFVDDLAFLGPIRVGDIVTLDGRMNQAFRTSMEVEVTVSREDTLTGARSACAIARLTFVNVDAEGRPQAVPPLALETEDDRARAAAADARRRRRLDSRHV